MRRSSLGRVRAGRREMAGMSDADLYKFVSERIAEFSKLQQIIQYFFSDIYYNESLMKEGVVKQMQVYGGKQALLAIFWAQRNQ